MKLQICLILSLILSVASIHAEGQMLITKNDTISLENDTIVKLVIPEHRGNIQWQKSQDSVVWGDLEGENSDTLFVKTDTEAIYRAFAIDGTCLPVYSDTAILKLDDLYIFDTKQDSVWDNWVISKDGSNFYVNFYDQKPTTAFFIPDTTQNGYPIFFNDNGLLSKMVIDSCVFLFDNIRDGMMDVALILPNGETKIFRDIECDISANAFTLKKAQVFQSDEWLAFSIKMTSHLIGVATCVSGLLATTSGVGAPIGIPLLIGCGSTVLSLLAEATPKDLRVLGLSANAIGKINTLIGCAGGDFVSCAVSIEKSILTITNEVLIYSNSENITTAQNRLHLETGTFTDSRDGNTYKWVKIGEQVWMAENLKTTKYNNGTSIPNVTDNAAWAALGSSPGYCWYNNDNSNANIYGALYNWYAVNTGKLCPVGWHIPSYNEWTILVDYLGGGYVAGGKLKDTSTSSWNSPNGGATNESGYTGLPGGYRQGVDGIFGDIGNMGTWWGADESDYQYAAGMYLTAENGWAVRSTMISKIHGYSVRCVKDEQASEIQIGQNFQGGIIFYINNTGQHGLIAAPTDQSTSINWYNGTYIVTGASGTAVGTGLSNTTSIISALGSGSYAASLCNQLVLNEYDDWFLPSKEELNLMFQIYSQLGLDEFADYWSSTESGGSSYGSGAWYRSKSFNGYGNEYYSARVRAIRAF